jgi:hypothetical protein
MQVYNAGSRGQSSRSSTIFRTTRSPPPDTLGPRWFRLSSTCADLVPISVRSFPPLRTLLPYRRRGREGFLLGIRGAFPAEPRALNAISGRTDPGISPLGRTSWICPVGPARASCWAIQRTTRSTGDRAGASAACTIREGKDGLRMTISTTPNVSSSRIPHISDHGASVDFAAATLKTT